MGDSFRIEALEGQVIAGHYRLIRLLGQGNFSSVFHGQLEVFGDPVRDVAVKVTKEPLPDRTTACERFSEFLLLAGTYDAIQDSAARQYIVPLLDLGIDERAGQRGYVVMELVMGRNSRPGDYRAPLTLEDEIRHFSQGLGPDMALSFLRQICTGMAAVHRQHVVHNDLKPDNILLTHDGQIRIADFGLAVRGHQMGNQLPTFRYMAPEIAEDHNCYPSSDVYTLGIVLYQLLTGRHPDDVISTPPELSHEQRHRAILDTKRRASFRLRPPSDYQRQVSSWLDRLTLDCLAFRKEERPADAGELLARLTRDAELPPDPQWPPSDWEQAMKELESRLAHVDRRRKPQPWFDLMKKTALCHIHLDRSQKAGASLDEMESFIAGGTVLRSYGERYAYYREMADAMKDQPHLRLLFRDYERKAMDASERCGRRAGGTTEEELRR